MKWIGVLLFTISVDAFAQGINVLRNGDVADAEKLNQNFNILSQRINAESAGALGYRYLGTTSKTLGEIKNERSGNGLNLLDENLWGLSIPCKSEFGEAAFVATKRSLEYFVFTGDSFPIPQHLSGLTLSRVLTTNGYLESFRAVVRISATVLSMDIQSHAWN